ncbi:hypothetical protein [Hyperthermus butylicus]|uniref:Uncharacterized protein n=1 Tax=Hyperthermus butylicus (strain DSM 5456 / JCM 9403 / PLM1-5) TaxID=415426 RepID=A2BMT3_HYPBU|nr:hypothetical protein [Hyperthermus butylicus]ABM81294.1 hypothetical protein Hbut_1470 [Hyperthermus butylicus DSM 5456]
MSSVMHSFIEKLPLRGCEKLLENISPLDVVSMAKLLPIAGISAKKDTVTVTYVYNPRARFGGKTKTKVIVDRTSSMLRLVGRGDLSFEARFSCYNDILTIYFVVTGKLVEMISEERARGVFNEIVDHVMMRARELGALREEAMQQPAAEVQTGEVVAQPAEVPAGFEAAAAPAAEAAEPVVAAAAQPAAVAAEARQHAEAAPTAPGAASGFSVSECMARLLTAGLPIDEELSGRIPLEYSPKLPTSELVEMGEAPLGKLDFSRYTDGYMVRLADESVRIDSVRLGGRVGLYLRSGGGEYLGTEALWRAIQEFCVDPEKKVIYIVVRV